MVLVLAKKVSILISVNCLITCNNAETKMCIQSMYKRTLPVFVKISGLDYKVRCSIFQLKLLVQHKRKRVLRRKLISKVMCKERRRF